MNDSEFYYYFHGTNITDASELESYFNDGLLNYRGPDMFSTLWPINVLTTNLSEQLKEYSGTKGNAVFVIKIPKYYITPKIVNGRLLQFPLPIWKSISQSGEHGEISQLPSELIYGVYISNNESFYTNPNYCPVHNPLGLQFDNRQIDYLLNSEAYQMYDFAVSRKGKSFEELSQLDELDKTWENVVTQYRNHFGLDTHAQNKML